MPEALRIALISEHASPLAHAGSVDAGGQNVYVAQVARCLAAAGHRVDVLTRRDDHTLPATVELRPNLRVIHIDAGPPTFVPKEALLPHMPAFAEQARGLFGVAGKPMNAMASDTIASAAIAGGGAGKARGTGYDLVHANFFMSGWVGLQLKRQFGVPLVTTFHALGLVRREHQGGADLFPAERIDIERALARDSDRVIAECPQDALDLQRLYGASDERLETVPCGVDTRAFRPGDKRAARRRLGLSPDEFIVLQLGRLVARKGIDNVVQAMARLPRAIAARLVVVGGDSAQPDERATPEIGRLLGIAESLGVADRVRFVGRRERAALRDWYVAADVFVTTPWYEPFGITPLEAMACATPVVGAAVGGIAHTVVDGETGFLVPPRDPRALADRLELLHAQPALAAELGRAGVRRVRAGFTWDHVAQRLGEVYASLPLRQPLARALPALHLPSAAAQAGARRYVRGAVAGSGAGAVAGALARVAP